MTLLVNKINHPVDFNALSRTVSRNIAQYKTKMPKWCNVTSVGKDLVRSHYFIEQNQRCAYCGKFYNNVKEMEIEHIAHWSKYRVFIMEPENLCLVCSVCNNLKLDKDNITTIPYNLTYQLNAFLIYHPHFDNPEEVFQYRYKYILIGIDINGKGKKSIEWLQLNAEARIKDRIMNYSNIKSINKKYAKLIKKASEYIRN